MDTVNSCDFLNSGRTRGTLAQYVWRAVVAGQDLLDGVAVAVPRPMEKATVPLTTRRLVDFLLAWSKRPTILALGLAGFGLMIPGPVEAEDTTACLLDYGGSLIEWPSTEEVTDRQASFIIGLTAGIRGCVVILACWARYQWVLSRAMGLLGAVR